MSEKKSWDVQRKQRSVSAPLQRESRPPERVVPVQKAPERVPVRAAPQRRVPEAAAPVRVRTQSSARRVAPQPLGALSKRRKQTRRTNRYILLTLFALIGIGGFYGLWRPAFRIQSISAEGPGGDSIKQIAEINIQGSYFHLIPKNSIVFYPKEKIRSAIIDANPDVSAVSLTAVSFSSLSIRTTPRAESFIWCGISFDTPSADTSCYKSDIEGFIFAQDSQTADVGPKPTPLTASTSTSTPPVVKVKPVSTSRSQIQVYGPLDKDISNGDSPIRAHLVLPTRIPRALKFVDAIRELGAPITSLVIRGDEADLWIGRATRITYVLGKENEAASSAVSALSTLSLTDGSIQYVDLRFPGKVYLKKYGE